MASNNIFQKAEDWLDDLETVGTYAAEKIGAVTKDMPIVKSLGAIAANPTSQEIGAQISNLASATNKGLQESFGGDPVDMALNYGPGAIGAMTAFHGTPHKIVGGFKKAAIGSGEGNQAFGHGFYATDAKGIAEEYADVLSSNRGGISVFDNATGAELGRYDPKRIPTSPQETAAWYVKLSHNGPNNKETIENAISKATAAGEDVDVINIIKGWGDKDIILGSKPGRVYTLDIPEPDVMLDWDKPFNQQPEAVKSSLLDAQGSKSGGWANLSSGKGIYNNLSSALGSAEKASEFLANKGVRGINYPAGTISGARTSSRNFVIFEPEDIKILAEDFLDQ